MTKKKQLEIAFKKLLIEMLESIGIDNWAPITNDSKGNGFFVLNNRTQSKSKKFNRFFAID